jgi:hypothetical protein
MRHTYRTLAALALIAGIAAASPANAQDTPTNFMEWLRAEVRRTIDKDARAVAANGNGVANQKESPSNDSTSTSLVDTTSATDFVSLALNVTGIRRDDGESSPTSGSVTASLYSLAAAARGRSLTDPQFYRRGTPLRRLALTIGSEESLPAEHFTDKPATNLGAKLLILNSRDVYSAHAQARLDAIDAAVDAYVVKQQQAINDIQCLIFLALEPGANPNLACTDQDQAYARFLLASFGPMNWPRTRAALDRQPEATANVNRVVSGLAASFEATAEGVTAAVQQIQRGRQLAVGYNATIREDDGTDEHRAELIFDYGFSTRLNWTVNASVEVGDRKTLEETRSGRFATEFQAKMSNAGAGVWSPRPVLLSGSIEGTKAENADWLVRAQAKLVIPLTTGVDVPIAYTYANRDHDGIDSGSRLKFSLAVDPVRFRERFR